MSALGSLLAGIERADGNQKLFGLQPRLRFFGHLPHDQKAALDWVASVIVQEFLLDIKFDW